MKLEDYFESVSSDEIRLRGTRIGIEAVLLEYLDGKLPEEIAISLPPLTLEQIHATITYYLGHQVEVEEYLDRWTARGDRALEGQRASGSPLLNRLRQMKTTATRS